MVKRGVTALRGCSSELPRPTPAAAAARDGIAMHFGFSSTWMKDSVLALRLLGRWLAFSKSHRWVKQPAVERM
jgi:hypothetical protein